MAEEFNTGGTNWWDSSSSSSSRNNINVNNNRFDSGSSSSGASSGLNNINSLVSFGWGSEMVDMKASAARSSMDSSVSAATHHNHDSPDHLHMMGLGLSSPSSLDWNQTLLRGDNIKSENVGFRSMLQVENLNNRGFSLDHHQHHHQPPQFSDSISHHHGGSSSDSSVTCQGLQATTSFQMDSSTLYQQSPPTIYQGLLAGSEHNNNQQQQSSFDSNNRSSSMNNYQYGTSGYGTMSTNNNIDHNSQQVVLMPSWSSKVPPFLRTSSSSPPKQEAQHHHHHQHQPAGQLHFSNNGAFWNASAGGGSSINNNIDHHHQARSSGFFPSLQTPILYPTQSTFVDEKPKHNISEVRDSSSAVKKNGSEPTSKRPRNETTTNLPAFKVRKEKMGDRITALQQLVSPFGKTDTASVLSEAIEYIKFLHEQVSILSTPYMKSGAAIQHQQNCDKSNKESDQGPKQDLRSRGLCLVPVSSTFPVAHESTVDFWTPTFGGTYR
ncbi:hypothetical protein Ddye_027167 [Dipteronia dyeriana]|uniref:BHLH domain-containing protein n=1 Tax=Dipteronia dyeriana TaxID=168575 RepID=A0AAD9TP16_9ROSI|nr:hypothetical protein Ddye_027167 [Dipteronia dyeriana]